MTLARLLPWKRVKPADPMQEVQSDPTPYVMGGKKTTEDALDKVARKFKTQADLWKRAALNTEAALLKVRAEHDELLGDLLTTRAKLRAADNALTQIASLETPGSAPAAKRMARIAREALPEYADGDQIAA